MNIRNELVRYGIFRYADSGDVDKNCAGVSNRPPTELIQLIPRTALRLHPHLGIARIAKARQSVGNVIDEGKRENILVYIPPPFRVGVDGTA